MKLISWNVAGRVKKQPQQIDAVLRQSPDLLALQEVTPKTSRMWRVGLEEAGFPNVLSSFDVFPEPEKLVCPRNTILYLGYIGM